MHSCTFHAKKRPNKRKKDQAITSEKDGKTYQVCRSFWNLRGSFPFFFQAVSSPGRCCYLCSGKRQLAKCAVGGGFEMCHYFFGKMNDLSLGTKRSGETR